VANQLIEGGIDSSIFENFIYEVMLHLRQDPALCRRPIILFMDNARIHCHPMVIESVLLRKGILLFNAQYSPSLNPVEQFFAYIKGNLQDKWIVER
jgi:transposase